MSSKSAASKLDNYITIRGQIAHRLATARTVRKSWSTDYMWHIEKLSDKTDGAIAEHLEKHVGKCPW
jgi:hypothetical protein